MHLQIKWSRYKVSSHLLTQWHTSVISDLCLCVWNDIQAHAYCLQHSIHCILAILRKKKSIQKYVQNAKIHVLTCNMLHYCNRLKPNESRMWVTLTTILSCLTVLRPVHPKNNNYNNNDNYINIHTNAQYRSVYYAGITVYVVCHFKCSSFIKSDEFWLAVWSDVFIVH